MTQRAIFRVVVAGQDISATLDPLLISMQISLHEKTHSDQASVTLDDSGGRIILPSQGDAMAVSLGWSGQGYSVVFVGTIDEVKATGSRGSGRELKITAKSVDTLGRAKERKHQHIDNATVRAALEKAGRAAGVTDIRVDPSLASITREWWGQENESFIHFGERIARETGGLFRVRGSTAILAAKGGGSVSGLELPGVAAAWPGNMISYDIAPRVGRPRYATSRSRHYDRKQAKWVDEDESVGDDDDAEAIFSDRYTRADQDEARASARNGAKESKREKGGGSVEIDGTATAQPGAICTVTGARPGIDGPYRIESVTHDFSRQGWTSTLELKQPHGGTGSDTRSKGGSGGSTTGSDDPAEPIFGP